MSKLNELYAKRKVFEDYGAPIPESLIREIEEAENGLLSYDVATQLIKKIPSNIYLKGHKKDVFVGLLYSDGVLTGIGATNSGENLFSKLRLDNVLDEIASDQTKQNNSVEKHRSAPIPFKVKFNNGTVISGQDGKTTLIETLRYMGLERVAKYQNRVFSGYPLVGKDQRPTVNYKKFQDYIDGWWIYFYMPTETKIQVIKELGEMLDIPLSVEVISSTPLKKSSSEKNSRISVRYSFNGSGPLYKSQTVLAVIRQFMSEIPNCTYEEIESQFPNYLRGHYGVVKRLDDVNKSHANVKDKNKIWFLEEYNILTSSDGVQFVVCRNWGSEFYRFQKHVYESFGWTIERYE